MSSKLPGNVFILGFRKHLQKYGSHLGCHLPIHRDVSARALGRCTYHLGFTPRFSTQDRRSVQQQGEQRTGSLSCKASGPLVVLVTQRQSRIAKPDRVNKFHGRLHGRSGPSKTGLSLCAVEERGGHLSLLEPIGVLRRPGNMTCFCALIAGPFAAGSLARWAVGAHLPRLLPVPQKCRTLLCTRNKPSGSIKYQRPDMAPTNKTI